MAAGNDITELNKALIANFAGTDLPGKVIPYRMMILGPSLLFSVFLCEILSFRFLKRVAGKAGTLKRSFIYLSTFVEVSFPCVIIFVSGNFLRGTNLMQPMQIVSSPLLIVLFIMIVLSALLLDPRLSFFAGVAGAAEYLLINWMFLRQEVVAGPLDYANAAIKSLFIAVSGLITGFVSKKIREAVLSSLDAKNELIFNLDKRVAEKTAEVVAQKTEIEVKNRLLEAKQKEILDSIHYARRIQCTQLPTEKYITRILTRIYASRNERRAGQ